VKILFDTNIIISALLNPASTPGRSLLHASEHHQLVLADHTIYELRDVTQRKFPKKQTDLETLLQTLPYELILAPQEANALIADPKDAPILNAAILADVEYIVSGDKHFQQMELEHPKVLTASDYLALMGVDSP
jgi:putative PIN family toxin of toxin-antitoxin system